MNNGSILYLTKNPRKTYAKSFSKTAYFLDILRGEKSKYSREYVATYLPILKQIDLQKNKTIAVDGEKNIWFLNVLIGYVHNSNTVICINKYFEQELNDWSRDA